MNEVQTGPDLSVEPEIWRPAEDLGGARRLVDVVLDQLTAWGVRYVYGVAGDTILPLIAAMGERTSPIFVPTRHEESAAFMAKAHAKLTGEPAVCVATAGPGVAHLINGLADAQTDSAPVLAITGQLESYYVGTVHKQVVNQQQLVGAVTEYSAELGHPAAVVDVLSRALRTSVASDKVSHVSIPKDFWLAPLPDARVRPFEPYLKTPSRSADEVIRGALDLLHRSMRPLIMVGIGARSAVGDVMRLAERLRAPIVYTLAMAGQIPRDHHLVVGALGEGGTSASVRLIAESDCILRLGTTWWPEKYVPPHPGLIDIDVKPEHVGIGAPATYGVVGPLEEILPRMTQDAPGWPRPEWESRVDAERRASEEQLARELHEAQGMQPQGVHPAAIVKAVNDQIATDAVITLDVGDHVLWFNRYFRGSGRQDVLLSGYWRTMGFGLPAAIAAKLVHPTRPAVALVGDGGISMALAEILTAVRHKLPVTVVVFNNGSLAMEENEMEKKEMTVHGVMLHNPDFARYAELCGAAGFRVERPEELSGTVYEALHSGRPAVVDVITDPVRVPSPAPPAWAELLPQT